MSPRNHVGKLARARIVPPSQGSLLGTPAEQVLAALVPGAETIRYRRLWRLGQVHHVDQYLHGRLGYEASTGVDLWDEAEQDFEHTDVPGGLATPFAIRLADLALIFQTRKQDIRVTSFTGAMLDILQQATGESGWDIVALSRAQSFGEWRRSVRNVRRLRLHLERPNPNYEGRPEVERLIEGLHLEVATLDLRGERIDTDVELTQQLMDHVTRGYGHAVAAGERDVEGETVETVWASELNGESTIVSVPASESGEVSVGDLIMELGRIEVGEEP
ncbi:hypothetical protein OG792_02810 [Micromonospora sp. NBC_01699]|uniref:hypothetical protein n=1 Tax=Micromonospora sp. NBC_01699 TaxID=2975984 RepID=UPI002E28A25D|nr:hypothetical protein [Micromonospora sp. NBC_01699]